VAQIVRPFKARPFLNIGLHGLDFLDATDGIPPALLERQPGLRVPAAEKIRRLTAAFVRAQERHTIVTLREAAGVYRRSARPGESAQRDDEDDDANETEDRVRGLQR
jgi:hypothetical protein